MTNKHTPAPWKAVINGVGYWEVVHPWPEQSFEEANHYSPTVVHVCTKEGDEQEANARLISAAPDLLEALKILTERIAYYASLAEGEAPNIEQWAYTDGSSDVAKARSAIAKATGGAQ